MRARAGLLAMLVGCGADAPMDGEAEAGSGGASTGGATAVATVEIVLHDCGVAAVDQPAPLLHARAAGVTTYPAGVHAAFCSAQPVMSEYV